MSLDPRAGPAAEAEGKVGGQPAKGASDAGPVAAGGWHV